MKKKYVIIVHVVFWVFYTIVPFLPFIFPERVYPSSTILYMVVNSILNIINFYVCYWYFGISSFNKSRIWKTTISFILINIMFTAGRIGATIGTYYIFKVDLSHLHVGLSVIVNEFLNTFGFSWVPVTIKYTLDWYREQQLKIELKNQNQSGEIAFLRSQINPHFLFNTLNNIYNLSLKNSEQAPVAIMKLSEIMRYMMNDSKADKVLLTNEIDYLSSFIELSRLRIKESDFIDFKINGSINNIYVCPLIFIPFIENAFKHGNRKSESPGIIIRFDVDNEYIKFECINYISKEELVSKDDSNGIGLHNVKRRLELLYPKKHNLIIENNSLKYVVKLELDIK
jgi:two-component system, LytTR family, sensor kinase